MNIFAVELTPYDKVGATEVTLRYATQGFVTTSGDTPGDAFFDERLKQPALLKRDAWGSGRIGGRRRVGFGDMVLLNGDGALDGILDYAYDGRDITVYYGEYAGTFATDMVKVFVGTMEVLEHDLTTITIKIRDRQQVVNVAFQETLYAGDNALPAGLEGVSDLKGKPKPILYGKVLNISPPLVNSAKLIYQVNDGAVATLDAVYDSGINLTYTPGNWEAVTNISGAFTGWGLAYSEDETRWVAVGGPNRIYTSDDDGGTWTSRTSNFTSTPSEVFGVLRDETNDLWIVCGDDGNISTSTDGATWTNRTTPSSGPQIYALATDGTTYVAVGSSNTVWTSTDGTTWTARTGVHSGSIRDVVWARNQFVAVGDDGEISTSPDGTTWTLQDTPLTTGDHLYAVAFGNGIYLAAGQIGTAVASTDGKSWAEKPMVSTSFVYDIEFDTNTSLFMLGRVSATAPLTTTPDGVTFIAYDAALGVPSTRAIHSFSGGAMAIGSAGAAAKLSSPGTYASEANLLDDDLQPAPGTYKVYATGGYFRLGSPPAGTVTADVTQGAAGSDRTAGQLYTDALIQVGLTSADWNAGDITALDIDNNDVLGYWSGVQSVQGSTVLDQLAASPGAWWGVDRTGIFRIQRLEDPSGETSTISLNQNDIILGTFRKRRETGPHGGVPVWRSVVRFAKNWTVQGADVAAGVSDARRGLISKEWQEEEDSTAAVKTTHPLAREQIDDSLITVAADAAAEATRRLGLFDSSHASYEFEVKLNSTNATIDLGTIIDLTFPRFGFASGSNVVVLSVDPDAERRTIRLGVWI